MIATGFDIAIAHHGGYAELAHVPAQWVVALPDGLDLMQAMVLGTAGFTAALVPSCGASPSCSIRMIGIDMLSRLGYHTAFYPQGIRS